LSNLLKAKPASSLISGLAHVPPERQASSVTIDQPVGILATGLSELRLVA
jgi:hypothetical protein